MNIIIIIILVIHQGNIMPIQQWSATLFYHELDQFTPDLCREWTSVETIIKGISM